MQELSFSKIFSRYLSKAPSHHGKLFEMLDIIIKEDPSLSYDSCLESAFYILSNMEEIFVERRGNWPLSFFVFKSP